MSEEKQMSLWVRTKGGEKAIEYKTLTEKIYQQILDQYDFENIGYPERLGASSFVRIVKDKHGVKKVLKIEPTGVSKEYEWLKANKNISPKTKLLSPQVMLLDYVDGKPKPVTVEQVVEIVEKIVSPNFSSTTLKSLSKIVENRRTWTIEQYETSPTNARVKHLHQPQFATFETKTKHLYYTDQTIRELSPIRNNHVIHGDLQTKNSLTTPTGKTFIIDPFVLTGEKEAEITLWLATLDDEMELEERLALLPPSWRTKRLALWLDFFALTEQRLYHDSRHKILNNWLSMRGKTILA